ncbi:MAG: VanZ family protein [Clostridia bacterium]|nr:VanZ family protein [Clostridia bacterium]
MKKSKSGVAAEWVAFILYIGLLVYFTIFAESMGRTVPIVSSSYRYNLVPLKEIKRFLCNTDTLGWKPVILNVVGNVVAFIPFGYFLPRLFKYRIKFIRAALITFDLSLAIEIIQLLTRVGSLDVDDLFLNTIGGVIGYILCAIVWWKHSKYYHKR